MRYSTLHEGRMLKRYIEKNKLPAGVKNRLAPGVIYKKAGISRATLYTWYEDERLSIKAIHKLKKAGIFPEDFLMDDLFSALTRIRELENEIAEFKIQLKTKRINHERRIIRELSST
jgi:hypothetical protein